MERLGFGGGAHYSATETAIHLARYQLAVPYCAGKRVLDIACGEGYGSQFLVSSGAMRVDAVDASAEAVEAARRYFPSDAIKHHVHDAHRVSELFPANTFDVVVSIETIEHLSDPARFLKEISAVAKKDATIIITCPNDNLYYPNDNQFNKHHVRKYNFQEFRLMAMAALGDDVRWGYGAPVIGFRNFGIEWSDSFDAADYRSVVLGVRENGTEMVLPVERPSQPHPAQSCYFIGVWNGNRQALTGSVVYPVAMEALERQAFLVSWNAEKPHPDQFRALIDEQKRRIELMTAEQSRLEGERQQLAAAMAALEARTAAMTAVAEQSKVERTRLEGELVTFGQDRARLEAHVAALDDKLAQEQARVTEAQRSLEVEKAAHSDASGRLATELAEVRLGFEAKRQAADSYRVQAFALKKEMDLLVAQVEEWRGVVAEKDVALTIVNQSLADLSGVHADVTAQQAGVVAELEQLRGEFATRQSGADVGLMRPRDEHAAQRTDIGAAVAGLRQELAARQLETDGYRMQAMALMKEVAVLTTNVQSMRGRLAEMQASRQAEIEAEAARVETARGAAEQAAVALPAAGAMPLPDLENARLDADRYRVQAFALSKELEILTRRVAELSVERSRALSAPGSAVGDLLREKEALERRVSALLLVAGNGTGGLKAQIVRSGKYRLRRAGIAVRPMLPASVLAVAMRVARKLNL